MKTPATKLAGRQGPSTKGSARKGTVRAGDTRPRSRRRTVLLTTGALAAAAVLLVTGLFLSHRDDRVATVAGHTVTRDELLFHMRMLAPEVQNELGLRGDWNAQALRRLSDRALDEIETDKTTLLLAQEQGLAGSVEYAGFLDEVAEENRQRADAIARGQVVYGLPDFSPEEYYSHRLTEITTALKQRLPLQVTDAEVRQAFDQDRDAWSANATTYRYSKLVVPVPREASGDYAAGLQRRVSATGRLAEVAEPGAKLTTATYEGGGSAVHDQDLTAVLGKLDAGQISAPVPGTGQITYYELDDKTVDEDAAFTEYSRRIRQSLIDAKFDQFLQRRVADSDIEVDAAAVDAINAEDVQQ